MYTIPIHAYNCRYLAVLAPNYSQQVPRGSHMRAGYGHPLQTKSMLSIFATMHFSAVWNFVLYFIWESSWFPITDVVILNIIDSRDVVVIYNTVVHTEQQLQW